LEISQNYGLARILHLLGSPFRDSAGESTWRLNNSDTNGQDCCLTSIWSLWTLIHALLLSFLLELLGTKRERAIAMHGLVDWADRADPTKINCPHPGHLLPSVSFRNSQ
jgi:hypothetical protein